MTTRELVKAAIVYYNIGIRLGKLRECVECRTITIHRYSPNGLVCQKHKPQGDPRAG